MGIETKADYYSEADRIRFKRRLDAELRALDRVLQQPGFGIGPQMLGAELELSLVDAHARPLAIAQSIVRAAGSPEITPEMGNFDIELCTPPVLFAGQPFSQLRTHMQRRVAEIQRHAQLRGGRVVPISILPTLRCEDLRLSAITDAPRYRALARGMSAARRAPFEISIEGEDRLHYTSSQGVAMEAANTAFQMHVTTEPQSFADRFNAAMLMSGPVLAAAGNSPTFLGKRLWHETRVALFKQAGDDRAEQRDPDLRLPPRVNFGNGWLRAGAHELFLESVALHEPLLPECTEELDPFEALKAGKLPKLSHLRLHHGTVWSWNRPVYDPENGGNLRIELRALPSGPSYDDMLANAAFLLGTMLSLQEGMPQLIEQLPFALAAQNFYLAAQHGLSAELSWPVAGALQKIQARELLLSLLSQARAGLAIAGVDAHEAEYFLGVFAARVRSGQTGAVWQRSILSQLHAQGIQGHAALTALVEHYMTQFESGYAVHLWPTELPAYVPPPMTERGVVEVADV